MHYDPLINCLISPSNRGKIFQVLKENVNGSLLQPKSQCDLIAAIRGDTETNFENRASARTKSGSSPARTYKIL